MGLASAKSIFSEVIASEGMTDVRRQVVAPFIEFSNRAAKLLGLDVRYCHGDGKNMTRNCSNIYVMSPKLNSLQTHDIIVGVAVRDKSVLYLRSDVDYETKHGSVSHQAGLRILSNILSRQYPDKAKEIDEIFDDVIQKHDLPSVGPIGAFVQDFLHNFRQPDYDY